MTCGKMCKENAVNYKLHTLFWAFNLNAAAFGQLFYKLLSFKLHFCLKNPRFEYIYIASFHSSKLVSQGIDKKK